MPRILIVYQTKPDIVSGLARGLTNSGAVPLCFFADQHQHWVDRYIFHSINKWAHNLRLLKKGKFLFTSHQLNHLNYLNIKLVEFYKKSKPDAVLFIHGINYSDHTLSKIHCPKIGWLVDPIATPERLYLFASKLDWYFSYSQTAIKALNTIGFIKTSYLSHAVDHQQFYPISPLIKSIDITFVGKHSMHRERYILAALEVTRNVYVYGSRWIARGFSHPSLFFSIKGSQCYGQKLNRLYNNSKIVLSIVAKPQSTKNLQSGINMRPFEVLATGALLMLDLHEELSPELVHENNLILFNSIDDFKTLLTKLLNNPSEIERIADNGQKFIENRYSYNEMAKTILSKFFEINHLLS